MMVARVVGYNGRIIFDSSRPDGTPRKLLDVSRIHALGWRAQVPLARGIACTYEWYRERYSKRASSREKLA
jgi:GDP-L-fucose synthase